MLSQVKFIHKCLFLFLFCSIAFAQTEIDTNQDKTLEKSSQLVDMKKTLANYRQDLKNLNQQIQTAKEETDKQALIEKKNQLLKKIQSLTGSFEEIATGGVKISDYTGKEEKKAFNWQEEMLEIFKPMIAELKQLTERPRTIERLRGQKSQIEEHLPVAESALKKIREVKSNVDDPATLEELNQLEDDWSKRSEELEKQLQLVSFQLEQKLNPPETAGKTMGDRFYEFMVGRGLTLLLAVITFTITFILMAFLSRSVEKQLSKKPNSRKQFFQRALNIALKSLTVLVSLLTTMLVLYIRGDWLILGLILIILLGTAWALRQSLPRYVREVKLMLNMGPVREGERVNYQGVPWRVTNLNFYTTFVNPLLDGGLIKLPVSVVVDLHSRPHAESEAWFPSKTGDFVILDNDLFGPVILQTPDIVQMKVLGGSTKTFATTDYLGLNPRNISHGFGLFINFGLDYNLQGEITQSIPQKLEAILKDRITQEPFANHLLSLGTAFNQASGSSLDVLIMTTWSGDAAPDYFGIRRFLQRVTVEACTENQWNIPFDNVTVHLDQKT